MPKRRFAGFCFLIAAQAFCTSLLNGQEPADVFKAGFEKSGLIIVPGRVMDKDAMCVLDTGTSINVVDKVFATQLAVSLKTQPIRTATGIIKAERFERVSTSCLLFPPLTGPAVAADLAGFSAVAGIQIDAFLGMDYLKPLILEMQAGAPRFRVRADHEQNATSISYEIRTVRELPFTDVELPILGELPFMIDTGTADYCGMTAEWLQRLLSENEAVLLEEISMLDASGVKKKRTFAIREFKVFGITLRNVPVAELDVNVIGLGIMRHLNFALDFENSVAYASPSPHAVDSFALDASGLRTVFQQDNRLIVRRVVPDSTAEQNMIQTGDQILQIDRRIASDLSFWEIRELLSQAGTTIPIKVKSGDQVRDVQLPLSRPFEYPPKWKPRSTQADDFQKFIESESKATPK